jgi:hypothetical protein
VLVLETSIVVVFVFETLLSLTLELELDEKLVLSELEVEVELDEEELELLPINSSAEAKRGMNTMMKTRPTVAVLWAIETCVLCMEIIIIAYSVLNIRRHEVTMDTLALQSILWQVLSLLVF